MTYDPAAFSAFLKQLASLIDAGLAAQPVEPAPVEPTEPAPVEPTPVDPVEPETPTDPVEPVPVDPAPVDPAPVDPVPAQPHPIITSRAELDAALASAQGGETLHFSGDFTAGLTLKNIKKASRVSLYAHGARAEFIDLIGCENLHFHGLTCYPTVFPLADKYRPLFRARLGSLNNGFIDCRGMGHETGRDYLSWTQADWDMRKVFGCILNSPNTEVTGMKLYGINFGVTIAADDCLVRASAAFGIGTDGFRILGDRSRFIDCTSADNVDIDPGHDDGQQSWEDDADKVLSDVTHQGFTMVEWLDKAKAKIGTGIGQGSGNFDGMYDRWNMTEATIVTDHYHGVTFGGLTNSTLEGLHVMHNGNPIKVGYPQIRIDPAKVSRGGFPSHHNTIRDCIAPRIVLNDDPATRIESGNIIGQPRNEAVYQATLERVRAIRDAA